jgi:altronate hydrolase
MNQSNLTIRLEVADNVVIARVALPTGTEILGEEAFCRTHIPIGHKIATARIEAGEPILKYGQIVGFATQTIEPGEHVHVHNMGVGKFALDHAIASDVRGTHYVDEGARATFRGIIRSDGRVATRNYVGVLSTVNCSASVARHIANSFGATELSAYPNVDGVVALCHSRGCGMDGQGQGLEVLQRTMTGYARHPNFAGVLLVGLGCETNQINSLLEAGGLLPGPNLQTVTIQDSGGSTKATCEGVARVEQMLQNANVVERQEVPVAHLTLALQCGASDAYSGMTANPALGVAVDLLVENGGTAVLSETPEICGAEHLLTRRAVSHKVGKKLLERIRWWRDYVTRSGGQINDNPTPGNKAGGLTTVFEKSLGAVAKAGTTNLVEVLGYAQPVAAKGLAFMDTPGYDPPSIAGMVAGGANVICFTTGRGSVFGCKPVPVIKLATNTAMFRHMRDDMDINCGTILDGEETVQETGQRIFRLLLDTASGQKAKSELVGIGDDEFVPWDIGAVM